MKPTTYCCEGKCKVYLGLKEDCDLDEFKMVLLDSEKNGTKVDIDSFVNSINVKPTI